MAYFLFKCWHERLFSLQRNGMHPCQSDLPITMKEITEENVEIVGELRDPLYVSQFRYQLSLGDFGFYAYLDGKPCGYGWVKRPGSDDYFFRISEGCRYLCRFFVHESVRGHGIYPALITELINHESECDSFFIDVERGNEASENGLKKVGFCFKKEFGFIRGFKRTFNKYTIH